MAQQSTTGPRETEKTTQGSKTREQQKAVINGADDTKGVDVDPHQKSVSEARVDADKRQGS